MSRLNETDPTDDGKTVFTDADVEPQILRVIRNAESQVTFVTPYIELWNHLKDEILEARRRNVQVLFFIRVGGRVKDPTDLPWLRNNISALYEVPMLHAKIYLNEKTVLVSSMNITMGSTRNSMDFAILVRRQGDAQELRDYVNRLPAKSTSKQPLSLGSYVSGLVKTAVNQSFPHYGRVSAQGYCIRGDEIIPLNPKRPFCDSHYQLWNAWKKDDYPEKYCHYCGKRAKTTARNPQCMDCLALVHTS